MPEGSWTATVVVIAKEPIPGRVKTRLMTAYTAEQAAALALAALEDTLAAARAVVGARVVLALDGRPGTWLPPQITVIPQRGDGLDERLAAAFDDAALPGVPTFLLGMDTPQVTATLIASCLASLGSTDAVLGLATDGGWWGLGLREPSADLLLGIPMSTDTTGAEQWKRLREKKLSVVLLPRLADVDTPSDAVTVAEGAPSTRFAARLRGFARPLDRVAS